MRCIRGGWSGDVGDGEMTCLCGGNGQGGRTIGGRRWLVCECGIKRLETIPDMSGYYRGQYREEHPVIEAEARKRIDFVRGKIPVLCTVLDVGCGRTPNSWDGVEPDESVSGVYRSVGEVDKYYDWLVCSHVIEHVEEPLVFMGKMKKLADKFFFIVPLEDYGEPHLYAFSEKGFDLIVKKVGFEIVESGFEPVVGYWTICTQNKTD